MNIVMMRVIILIMMITMIEVIVIMKTGMMM